ncbi:MAG TPA: hypothetical protein VE957_22595 [Terriglobales bacterium]|nr:hypothetical protein [Terriglobales bacterium]
MFSRSLSWQARYYDFNVWSEQKRVEKLRYIHRNPVKRGLVERPEAMLAERQMRSAHDYQKRMPSEPVCWRKIENCDPKWHACRHWTYAFGPC